MDDLARKYVTESCGRALGALLDPNDLSVWVIDGLQVDLLIDVHAACPTISPRFGPRESRRRSPPRTPAATTGFASYVSPIAQRISRTCLASWRPVAPGPGRISQSSTPSAACPRERPSAKPCCASLPRQKLRSPCCWRQTVWRRFAPCCRRGIRKGSLPVVPEMPLIPLPP